MLHELRQITKIRIVVAQLLYPNNIAIDSELSLVPEDIQHSRQNYDQPVAGVSRPANHAYEIGGLATLNVTDNQPFCLVGLFPSGIRQTFDDLSR